MAVLLQGESASLEQMRRLIQEELSKQLDGINNTFTVAPALMKLIDVLTAAPSL